MIHTQDGIRTIWSSDAPENAPGDLVAIRTLKRTHKYVQSIAEGWRLLGISTTEAYTDAVYVFDGEPS